MDGVVQHGAGQPGSVRVERKERGECMERYVDWAVGVHKIDAREGKRRGEYGFGQARQTGNVGKAEAFLLEIVRREQAALQNDAVRFCARRLDPHAGEGILEGVADVRAIEYLPILEVAAAA